MGIQLNTKKMARIMNLTINNESKSAELILYGDIGDSFWDDISSKEIVSQLEKLDVDNIIVNINSNGGGTTAAIAISNALKRHKAKVTANIDGIVASAATIITSACDIVKMPKNALFMIHNPWTIAMGEEKDFNKMAETLSKVKNSIIESYVSKTDLSREKISELMDKESWFSATEAKEYGFIDEIIENTDIETVNNKVLSNGMVFNMGNFKNFNIPKQINNNEEEEKIVDKKEFMNKYPEIYKEIVNEAKEVGKIEERERIKALEELGVESEIVNKAKFETFESANDIAVDLIKEMKNSTKPDTESTSKEKEDYRNQNPPLQNNHFGNGEKTAEERDKEEAEKIVAMAKGGIK